MNLKEYMKKVRKSNALSKVEIEMFGITNMSKGWVKRYAHIEVTEDMIKAISQIMPLKQKKGKGARKANRQASMILQAAKKYEVSDTKLLYVLKNSRGDLKIGISIDPIRRARHLTNASGTSTMCLAAWELEKNSRSVEAMLHKEYTKYRKEGEWFEPRSFTVKDIENKIPCLFKRVYSAEFETSSVEMEEYVYMHIKHETEKATLYRINSVDIWIPKSRILVEDREKHIIKVPIGFISEKLSVA